MALTEFGSGVGFLKAGFLGFPKSGKTWTSALLALEVWKQFKYRTPIAVCDTETGGEYISPMIQKVTGIRPVGKKSRSMADLVSLARECEAGAASILIVDSITHIWREVCAAYLDQVNQIRQSKGKSKRSRLEFQDWAAIKEKWAQWTDFYLNSKLHIIICGRAGYEWDFEEREEADGQMRKELVKTGIKMKVESEFGFEPSLLIHMAQVQIPDENFPSGFRMVHRAQVIGDRFNAMDGAIRDNPQGDWFAPHINMLVPGAENVVDTTLRTDHGVDEGGDTQFQAERREKAKVLEEIQGELVKAFPGQTAAERRGKVEGLEAAFGTKSWTAVEGKSHQALSQGLLNLRQWIADRPVGAGKGE